MLGVIPARGGSKGLPRKNVLPMGGMPLILHTVAHARAAHAFDAFVVSSEDPEILAVCAAASVRTVSRPPEMATDHAPVDLALRHALHAAEAEDGRRYDLVVWLQANVPLRETGLIDGVVRMLVETGADSVQTVAPLDVPPEWCYEVGESARLAPFLGVFSKATRRQDCRAAVRPDGAVVAMRRDLLLSSEGAERVDAYLGDDMRGYVHDRNYAIEIDDQADFAWAEFQMRRLGNVGTSLRLSDVAY